MIRRLTLLCLVIILPVFAFPYDAAWEDIPTNIYRVYVRSQGDAETLSGLSLNAFMRVENGYLVQARSDVEPVMAASGVDYELIATGINRSHLALDMRRDRQNADKYPVIYEQGNLRLFRIDPADRDLSPGWQGLAPVLSDNLKIVYREPKLLDLSRVPLILDLDSLAGSMPVDSCQSYVERLQAFQTRWSGTDSCLASRDWLMNKFHEFGYDSVFCDTFMSNHTYGGWDLVEAHNVIAVKVGSVYPDHQIVLGAHRDSYPLESPGADDNGSGCGAVLEIARILNNIDTRMTFVFVLFDTEETGLFGSWNYSNRASRRGDSIVLMINMDVIAYDPGTDTVFASNTPGSPFGPIWYNLADSLTSTNLKVLPDNQAFADGLSFEMNGFNVIEIFERIFNPYMHTAHDSTVYLDFDYMTRIARTSLVTVYLIDQTYVPDPMLKFAFPNGVPELLAPNVPTTFEVAVDGYADGVLVPGSALLHYSINDGSFETSPLTEIGVGLFEATLPACPCDSRIDFYISAQETGGGTFTSTEPEKPYLAATGVVMNVLGDYNFETQDSWQVYGTASQGLWTRTYPHGYGHNAEVPIDFDGSGKCFLTGPETNPWSYLYTDVDDGTTVLRSPVIDMSEGQVLVQYALWYSNHFGSAPYSDVFEVNISNDAGATWTTVETVGPVEQASGGWYFRRFWVNDVIEPTSLMRITFEASDLGSDSNIEAAIDAVKVVTFTCEADVEIITEDIPDWTTGIPYSIQLESSGGFGTLTWTDKFDNLSGTGLVLSSDGLVTGTPAAAGTISFTAVVTDELLRADERPYTFILNSEPLITTTAIPDATAGEPFAFLLSCSGGTGSIVWSDFDNGLQGTGISLSAEGVLTGTPPDTGTVAFTARIEDAVGAYNEKLFDFHIGPVYICGDANGDTEVNVGDAVAIINFVFKGGSPPEPLEAGDADGNGEVNIADAVHIINFVFKGGPPPQC